MWNLSKLRLLHQTEDTNETVCSKCVVASTEYFNLDINIEFQKYTFYHCMQSHETINEYYSRLEQLATTCSFYNEDSEIKSLDANQ